MAFNVTVDRKEDIASLTPELVRKGHAERAEKLHLVFEQAGENLDAKSVTIIDAPDGQALAKQIAAMNDELSWFGERITELDKLDAARKGAQSAHEYAKGYQGNPGQFAPRGDGEKPKAAPLSFGQAFVKSDAFNAAKGKQQANATFTDVDAKSVLEQKATFLTSAGWAPESLRTGRVVLNAQREIEVTDAIPLFPTTMAAIVYMEETTFTNAAAERAENAAYAEAALALTERSVTVRSIGASLPVTDEQLADEEAVASYLDQRLMFMVRQRLDGQILTGNGTPPNLTGTLSVGGINTVAKGSDPTPDAIYKGIKAARVTGRSQPNVVFAHPNDWQDVRLLRTADGVYIWGNPSEAGPMRIWGLPVIETTAVTENTIVTGDYARFSGLHVRSGMDVQVGYVADDFKEGRVTIRAGMRVALVHYRPAAFTQITGV